ncbi:hypothetical protein HZB93_03095 [Candidatus Falkowbacteria bacterium]|nr:hypothetical protein [Candidatus Falkowbacteria bacterium]
MNEFGQDAAPKSEIEKLEKITREEVEARLARGENLENLYLVDLDLAGLDFEGKSFRGSDIRGVYFYGEKRDENGKIIELITNLRRSDFTDTTIADTGQDTIFGRVEAEGATFGFTEDLISRRNRHAAMNNSGERPDAADSGGLYGFNGGGGNFKKTKWDNIDFGGDSGSEALFPGADLSEGEIVGSDLSGLDLSTTKIDGIKIKDPLSLQGLIISEQQIDTLAKAIELSDEKERQKFAEEVKQKGSRKALEDYFKVIIK